MGLACCGRVARGSVRHAVQRSQAAHAEKHAQELSDLKCSLIRKPVSVMVLGGVRSF
jgi:hypothetical protein